MSTQPPENTPGPIDQLALHYLRRGLDTVHPADAPFVMTEQENRVISRVHRQTLSLAALTGLLGAALLYVPMQLWPSFFAPASFWLLGYSLDLPLITGLYGLLLLYLETYALLYINTRAARYVMAVCQFPRQHDAQYERHLYALAEATREQDKLGFIRYGLDPYIGLPHWGLTAFFAVNKGKAIITLQLVQAALKRLLEGVLVRYVVQLVSLPIYAAWNVWASHRVIQEAKIRVMAPITIRDFVDELYEQWRHNEAFCRLIPEALEYVAILKRQHNYAHLLLTETLMDRFGLQVIQPEGHFLDQLDAAPAEVRQPLERLIIFGVLIDGGLSWFEARRLRQLQQRNWLSYSIAEIRQIGREYYRGRGLWV